MLIIDDQHSVCVSLDYFLGGAGYRVVTAESGTAAFALFETHPIDAALIDIHMPGMNGFDVCLRLQAKAQELGRSLRVWFMTGAFSRALDRRAVELGALGVLRKPFDYATVLSVFDAGFSAPVTSRPSTEPASLTP